MILSRDDQIQVRGGNAQSSRKRTIHLRDHALAREARVYYLLNIAHNAKNVNGARARDSVDSRHKLVNIGRQLFVAIGRSMRQFDSIRFRLLRRYCGGKYCSGLSALR